MPAGKRMLLALVCVVLAVLLLGFVGAASSLRYGWRHTLPVFGILPAYLLFSLPGWVLALPFVLAFRDAEGWRPAAILAIGMAIGPAFILGTSLLKSHGHLDWRANGSAVLMAFFIGTVTTVLYVLLLRRFCRRQLTTGS
ncbi:MAG TPA: hypothetical protein VKV02_05150 [Acidobacteriaceae bacterium]|nr:hypothetical protein [Acidobacteriaceae bacterium]